MYLIAYLRGEMRGYCVVPECRHEVAGMYLHYFDFFFAPGFAHRVRSAARAEDLINQKQRVNIWSVIPWFRSEPSSYLATWLEEDV